MRIALVINSLGIGGAERVLTTLASHWAKESHQVSIFTFESPDSTCIFNIDERVTVTRLNSALSLTSPIRALLGMPSLLIKLRQAIVAFKPERVITFMDQTNILTIMALAGTKFNIHVSERVDPQSSSLMTLNVPGFIKNWINSLREWFYGYAERIVVQTEGAKERFSPKLRSKVVSIPNPVAIPSEIIQSYESKVIIGLGRLVHQKRFDILISAFQSIHARFPDWRVIIFGNGSGRELLQQQIDAAELGDKILLPGAVKDPIEAFKYGSIFVLASQAEGFPGALGEAMAYGMAVVSTNCNFGPSEIITDGMDGLIVPVNDSQKLAEALANLMESPGLRESYGKSAQKIVSRFEIEKISKLWLAT